MKTKLITALSLIVLIICTGCPYESKYNLNGEVIVYDQNLIGNWKSEKVDIKISRIDDKTFNYQYDDHNPETGAGKVEGTGYVVSNNDTEYIVAKKHNKSENNSTYTVYVTYKIKSIDKNMVKLIPLDGKNASPYRNHIRSETDFTYFVTKMPEAFADIEVVEYIRQ